MIRAKLSRVNSQNHDLCCQDLTLFLFAFSHKKVSPPPSRPNLDIGLSDLEYIRCNYSHKASI